jgi:hypothetical protein
MLLRGAVHGGKKTEKPVLSSAVCIMFSNFLQINCNIVVWPFCIVAWLFYVLCCCILYHRERMYRYSTYPVCFVEKNSGSSVPLPPPHIFPNDFCPCCGFALVSVRIGIQHFWSMFIRIRVQGIDD